MMLIHNETIRLYIGKLLVNWIAIANIPIMYVFFKAIYEPNQIGFFIFISFLCSILFIAFCWLAGFLIALCFNKEVETYKFLFEKPFSFIPSHYLTDSRDLHKSTTEIYGDQIVSLWAKITFLKWW